MPDDPISSELRVFFSADLAGSTRLKNRLNHQELYDKYKSRIGVLNKVREKNEGVQFDDQVAQAAALESLGISGEDLDWAAVVEFFYESLHSEFSVNVKKVKERHRLDAITDPEPWKAVGDELIYQFVVRSRHELHWITVAFLAALRAIDGKVKNRGGAERGLRIKGSAWVAGFPVRNRIIRLPAINTEDFLGPDIDTGFRIGKCTQPGMLVVSVELAELLSEAPGDVNPIVGKIVGWEGLKGVWNDKRYPVIWVDLPSGYQGADTDFKAQKFDPWQQEDCAWCKVWEREPACHPLREFVETLRETRSSLPKALGLVDPYIVGDKDHQDKMDQVPSEHHQILQLLRVVKEHQAGVLKQDADEVQVESRDAGVEEIPALDGLLQQPQQVERKGSPARHGA